MQVQSFQVQILDARGLIQKNVLNSYVFYRTGLSFDKNTRAKQLTILSCYLTAFT